MARKADLFEDLAVALQSWTATTSTALTDPEADLAWVEAEGHTEKFSARLPPAG